MPRGDIVVRLIGDARDLERKFQSASGRISGIGKSLTGTLTPAAAAIGVAFGAAFKEFDTGVDSLRAGTGKTGAALASLEQSAKNVAGTVTQGFGEVGTVMSELAARTGLTGKPLENLTRQILTLARITNTDAKSSVAGITRLFGDWGIKTKQQTATLDQLLRVSQATGVPIDRLAELMVKFGAPLRQFNFGFDEAALTLAKFEREGVNTELVMGALRIALGRFSGTGEEVTEELGQLKDQAQASRDRIQGLSDGVASASKRLADLRENVTGAHTRIGDLARELDKAKRSLEGALAGASAEDLEGATIGVERAKLREAEATNEVEDAERALRDARKSKDAEAIERAEIRLKGARLSARESQLATIEAEKRLNELKKKGTEQDEEVIAARERVDQVTRQQADAERDLGKAYEAVAEGQRDVGRAAAELGKERGNLGAIEQSIADLKSLKTDSPAQALRETFDAIKNAGSIAEANSIGLKVFGKRAGPDMVAAIREGRFSIEDLQRIVASSSDTISKAGKDTVDWSDKLAQLKNKVVPVIGPIGEIGLAAAGIAAGIGPALIVLPKLATVLKVVGVAAKFLFANPIGLAILAVIVAVVLLIKHWDKVKAFLMRVWGALKTAGKAVFDFLKFLFLNFTPHGLIIKHWRTIFEFLSRVWEKMKSAFGSVKDFFLNAIRGIKDAFGKAFGFIGDIFKGALNVLIDAWNKLDFGISVKVPDWVPLIGGKKFEIKDLFPDIPRLALGGVITRSTIANIGEAGPEAVIPLDRFRGLGRTVNYHITINVPPTANKAEIGREVVAVIKAYEKRSGKSWRAA